MLNRFHHGGIDDHYVYPDDDPIHDRDELPADYPARYEYDSPGLEHIGTFDQRSAVDLRIYDAICDAVDRGEFDVYRTRVDPWIVVHRRAATGR